MKVEIKDGHIVGYSRIGKWANKNNISYKVLSRMVHNGELSKDNYFELEGLIFIKDSLVLPKELCIQRNNEGPKRILVENLHKPCSKEQMMDEMEQVLGKDRLATRVLNTIQCSDKINSYTDLAWWINNCWVEKYSSSETFHQPVRKYIYGIGKRSWLLLARKIFNYHNEEVI